MNCKSCYDEVIKFVSEAESRLGVGFSLNEARSKRLKSVCAAIDTLITKLEFDYYEVAVDDTDKRLTVSLFCDEIILEGDQAKKFFSLIKQIDSFAFAKSKDDGIRIDLNIDELWVGK